MRYILLLVALICLPGLMRAGTIPLNAGDRVLFIGNGFVEQDQWHAYVETRLQRRVPDLTFRSLGWSGDTVRGSARTAGFQVPQGLARLEKDSAALKPTVIFLAYGMNESFDGPQALPAFLQDYDKLLKTLAPLKARFVILSPTYHEDLGRPFPDPAEHNQHLEQITAALKDFAAERKLSLVDLFHPLASAKKADAKIRLTTNGLLLTQEGSIVVGEAVEQQLGYTPYRWEVAIDRDGKLVQSVGTKLTSISTKARTLRFEASDTMLPKAADAHELRVTGLLPGMYTLRIDRETIIHAAAEVWQKGLSLPNGPRLLDTEKLRAAIVLRNQLFYRRWRPYNDHSRHWGFIGGDFKLYDQEIAAQEQRIAELRKTRLRSYEIAPK